MMHHLRLPGELAPLAPVLTTVVSDLVQEGFTAIALTGSQARGQADPFSDIDLVCLVNSLPAEGMEIDRLFYAHDQLVSVSVRTLASRLDHLTRPETAIHAVAPWRSAVLLEDRGGLLTAVQQAAQAFRWASLHVAADHYAATAVLHQVEVAHKLLGSLATGDAARAVIFIWELVQALTTAVAVQRGVLIESGNTFLAQVRHAVGDDSVWSRDHRLAIGLERDADTAIAPLLAQARASLCLFSSTGRLIEPVFTQRQLAVVRQTMQRIEARR